MYVRVNMNKELQKAAQGKKTKIPVGFILHWATEGYPLIQKAITKAFGIYER